MKETVHRVTFAAWGFVFMLTCFSLHNLLQADLKSTVNDLTYTEHMSNVELLISQDEIKSKIAQVAQVLDAYYQGEEVTIVLVMKGAICIAADLIRELKGPSTLEYVTASSYGQRGTKRGDLKIIGLDSLDLHAKHVLLVDDIFDSGETLTRILAKLQEMNPKTLKSLVLLAKKVPRDISYYPDYALFEIENQFVIGYGLDYKEQYRGLPGIFLLKSDAR